MRARFELKLRRHSWKVDLEVAAVRGYRIFELSHGHGGTSVILHVRPESLRANSSASSSVLAQAHVLTVGIGLRLSCLFAVPVAYDQAHYCDTSNLIVLPRV